MDRAEIDFRAVFGAVPSPCLVLTTDLEIVDANQAYLEATGRSFEDLFGRFLFDAFPDNPEDPHADGTRNLSASLNRVLATGAPDTMAVQKYDIPVAGQPGVFEERYWSPVNVPVLDADGKVVLLLHRVEEITAFIRARGGADGASRAEEMEAELFARAQELQRLNEELRAAHAEQGRLHEQAEQRHAWERAHAEITTALLQGREPDEVLRLVAERAREVARADIAALALPGPGTSMLVVRDPAGPHTTGLAGLQLPVDSSLCGQVYREGTPLISDSMATPLPGGAPSNTGAGRLGPVMIAPLAEGQHTTGVLFVARTQGKPAFDQQELDMLTMFAGQAALALQVAAQRAHLEAMHQMEDRERIATALRDRTIKEVFAITMTLNSLATALRADHQTAVMDVTVRLDKVIRDIQTAVFSAAPDAGRPEGSPAAGDGE
ncbi:GAF domain-containing protein [Streptomyces sp. NPDC048324]|uniref:GAF domain-containing protein n=1 Tax=Streptomyces sp. NPDC048324 TaxID=3157205 RepID=UPI00342BEFFA